jgi:quercetin dioxygenase-like cupin family protein
MSNYVRKQGTRERVTVQAGTGTSMEVWIGRDEAPHFALRRFVMEPGGGMPLHTNRVEHEQYVLQGSATIRIGETDYAVAAGDAVFIPAGIPHSYRAGSDGFAFLCIVPNQDDQIEILG